MFLSLDVYTPYLIALKQKYCQKYYLMKLDMNGSLGYTDPTTRKEASIPMDITSDMTFSTTRK